MAPGSYTAVNLAGMNPTGMVTITALDPGHPPVIAWLNVAGSSNLTFSDLEVTSKGGFAYAVRMGAVTNVALRPSRTSTPRRPPTTAPA